MSFRAAYEFLGRPANGYTFPLHSYFQVYPELRLSQVYGSRLRGEGNPYSDDIRISSRLFKIVESIRGSSETILLVKPNSAGKASRSPMVGSRFSAKDRKVFVKPALEAMDFCAALCLLSYSIAGFATGMRTTRFLPCRSTSESCCTATLSVSEIGQRGHCTAQEGAKTLEDEPY